jgi:hypothetical protein
MPGPTPNPASVFSSISPAKAPISLTKTLSYHADPERGDSPRLTLVPVPDLQPLLLSERELLPGPPPASSPAAAQRIATARSLGTYSAMRCLPGECRVDTIMTSSDEYRRRAGECLLFTHYVTSEMSKHLLVQMARGWHDLAERVEQQKLSATSAERASGGSENT